MINYIYEDKNIIVVNKPAGIAVHPTESSFAKASEDEQKTLVSFLLKTHPEIKDVGDPSTGSGQVNLRPGIVHRLDKDTSGVLIIAKNQPAFEYLKNQFQERKIKKTYIALVEGNLNPPSASWRSGKKGIINLPIGRSKKSPTLRLASPKARGKLREAITEYKVLENLKNYTLVEAYPETGRTHQIRAHFKAIGHPVVGDILYGNKKKMSCLALPDGRQAAGRPFGLSRQFLHARSIELTLPDGSRASFEADLPKDLEKVLEGLRKENQRAKLK